MLLSANADIKQAEYLAAIGYDAIDVGLCRVIYHDDPYPHNPMLDEDDYEKLLLPLPLNEKSGPSFILLILVMSIVCITSLKVIVV